MCVGKFQIRQKKLHVNLCNYDPGVFWWSVRAVHKNYNDARVHKRKEKFTLFSDRNGSLLRRQPRDLGCTRTTMMLGCTRRTRGPVLPPPYCGAGAACGQKGRLHRGPPPASHRQPIHLCFGGHTPDLCHPGHCVTALETCTLASWMQTGRQSQDGKDTVSGKGSAQGWCEGLTERCRL